MWYGKACSHLNALTAISVLLLVQAVYLPACQAGTKKGKIRNLGTVTVHEASEEFPRCSEGSIIQLKNGDLFIVFQRYDKSPRGSEDNAPNKLVSMRSMDGGRTWGNLRVEVVPEPGDVNVYSPNLIRLKDGSILFLYERFLKSDGETAVSTAVAARSYDECATFTKHGTVWEKESQSFASDCVRLLSDGRLLIPVERSNAGGKYVAGCVVSDDDGRTWRTCSHWVYLPMRGAMEPHVEELKDGRLLMVMRSQLGAVFKAHSADRGETWSKPQTSGVRAPESCPELKRAPGSGKLMLIWNNSEYDPYFRSHYGKRSPLSVALSDDEGETFRHVGDIETDPGWAYSNPGAYFLKNGKCIVNYWAVKYTPDWVMRGPIHLKTSTFDLP